MERAMTIAEKLEYTHRRLLAATDSEQELMMIGEFLTPLGRGETFAEMVRFFTTRLDDVVAKLRQLSAQNKMPGYLARIENPQVWILLAWTLIERKMPQVGRELFIAMYEFQVAQQAEIRRRCYKGISLQNLGWANYLLGDVRAARKVVFLALVEEVFNTLEMDAGTQLRIVSANPAYQMLRQTLNISADELDHFVHFAREYAHRHPERCVFPEDCYINFLRAGASGRALEEPTRISIFNGSYFTTLLDMLGRAATADTADLLLADLVCYLFATVDQFELCEQTRFSTEGFDLVVRNLIGDDPVIAALGNYLLLEWHHWLRELRVDDLISIAGRLRLAGQRTAILFVRDFDGNSRANQAALLQTSVQRLYQQEQIFILIIKQSDLINIERRQLDLIRLLKLKLETLRFHNIGGVGEAAPVYEPRRDLMPTRDIMPGRDVMSTIDYNARPTDYNSRQTDYNARPTMPPSGAAITQTFSTQPPPVMHLPPQLPPAISPASPPSQMAPIMPVVAPATPPPPPPATPTRLVITHQSSPLSPGPVKPPRLVIRGTTSRPKPVENPNPNPPGNLYKSEVYKQESYKPESYKQPDGYKPESYKPEVYKAVVAKPYETPLLKPCTSCKNPTSLVCQTCSKPFCNVHLNMSTLKCETCLATPAEPVPVVEPENTATTTPLVDEVNKDLKME